MPRKAKSKKKPSHELEGRLARLEQQASMKGIRVRYDLLEAAGLKLKGGLCKINGEYHLFIDRRKSTAEKIDLLQDCLSHPFPEDVPEIEP
jgi:hypothetical protein